MNFLLRGSSIPPPPLVFVAKYSRPFSAKLVAGYDTSNFDSITIKRGRENLAQVEQVHARLHEISYTVLHSILFDSLLFRLFLFRTTRWILHT